MDKFKHDEILNPFYRKIYLCNSNSNSKGIVTFCYEEDTTEYKQQFISYINRYVEGEYTNTNFFKLIRTIVHAKTYHDKIETCKSLLNEFPNIPSICLVYWIAKIEI